MNVPAPISITNRVRLWLGDCLEVMKAMEDCSVDAIVTDPPAGIGFMGKTWDKPGVLGVSGGNAMPSTTSSRNPSCRKCGGRKRAGPATKECVCEDGADWNDIEYRLKDRDAFVSWLSSVMRECLRVLKPGGHALVWALPRTSHWTAWALEDAGFEVRDRVSHLFGSGFPKSHNLPGGWGTALKPACEDWWLCRKPLSEKTVAANVLKWGTGAINIDACRVGNEAVTLRVGDLSDWSYNRGDNTLNRSHVDKTPRQVTGRWPSNLTHDGSPEVLALFPESSVGHTPKARGRGGISCDGHKGQDEVEEAWHGSGSAARFFYCAKASRDDRDEGLGGKHNRHPTVKATELMRYLCRLITPPDGLVLDMFMGSGSTGKAAVLEGFSFVGIEQEQEYFDVARKRIIDALGPLFVEGAKKALEALPKEKP